MLLQSGDRRRVARHGRRWLWDRGSDSVGVTGAFRLWRHRDLSRTISAGDLGSYAHFAAPTWMGRANIDVGSVTLAGSRLRRAASPTAAPRIFVTVTHVAAVTRCDALSGSVAYARAIT